MAVRAAALAASGLILWRSMRRRRALRPCGAARLYVVPEPPDGEAMDG